MKNSKKLLRHSLYILLACVFYSCSDKQRVRYVCSCEQNEKVGMFLKETIADANNMSDEEMEDVIHELNETAVRLNCSQKLIWFTHEGAYIPERNKLDSCQTIIF